MFGKANINILLLSVCYEGIAFLLLWQMLNKAALTRKTGSMGRSRTFESCR
jgi:hypothetical protein